MNPPKSRAAPLGILRMLALVCLAESAVARHELDLAGNLAWDWRRMVGPRRPMSSASATASPGAVPV